MDATTTPKPARTDSTTPSTDNDHQPPDQLIRERQFVNRAAKPHENLMIVQLYKTSSGEQYTRTFFKAWKGL